MTQFPGNNPFCQDNPLSPLCEGNDWPDVGGGLPNAGDCSVEFPDPDIFSRTYDPGDFTAWHWYSPSPIGDGGGFELIVTSPGPVQTSSNGNGSFVRKIYTVDTRGLYSHPGRRGGPGENNSGTGSIFDTAVPITSIQDYAISSARSLIAQIVADGYPEDIAFSFYAQGSNITPDVSPYDVNTFGSTRADQADAIGTELSSAHKTLFYSTVSPGAVSSTDGIDLSVGDEGQPNFFSPRLSFHPQDALNETANFNISGVTDNLLIFDRVTSSNVNLSNTDIVDGIQANKTHRTPFIAWTPWFTNGVAETKLFMDAFIDEYKRIQQEIFLLSGNIIKNPVRLFMDNELFPKTYNSNPIKMFSLCKLDSRYNSEILFGWNRTLKDIVDGTPSRLVDLSTETTELDGLAQAVSLSSWEWEANSNGHNGVIFTHDGAILTGENYNLPQPREGSNPGIWQNVGSGQWWAGNDRSVPSIAGHRRYDLVTFCTWWDHICEVAYEAALKESVYEPLKEAFPGIVCSNYDTNSISQPSFYSGAKAPTNFTGSNRTDVNDYGVFVSKQSGDEIVSPIYYAVDAGYIPDITDRYDARKKFFSDSIDFTLSTPTGTSPEDIKSRSLIHTDNISPYSIDGVGSLSFDPQPTNIIPWVLRPTAQALSGNPIESEETACDMYRMMRRKGIKEVLAWGSSGWDTVVDAIDESVNESNLPAFAGDSHDVYDAVARSEVTNPTETLCCRPEFEGGWYFWDYGYHFDQSGDEIYSKMIKFRNPENTTFNELIGTNGGGWSIVTASTIDVNTNIGPIELAENGQSTINQDSPSIVGGVGSLLPTIDFRTAADSTIANLGPIDFAKYVTCIENNALAHITTRLTSNGIRNEAHKTSEVIILDFEIKNLDSTFAKETGQAFVRNVGAVLPDTGTRPFSIDLSVYWSGNDAGGRATQTPAQQSKWIRVKQFIINAIQHTKAIAGHDRVAYYDTPFRFFQNDIWQFLDSTRYNGISTHPNRFREAVEFAMLNTDIQDIMTENYINNMAWYAAKFAHKKIFWDKLVDAVSAFGDRSAIWTAASYYGFNLPANQDPFDGWNDLPSEYITVGQNSIYPQVTTATPTSNNIFLHRGIIKYIGETARDKRVRVFNWTPISVSSDLGIFSPFDTQLNREEGDKIIDGETEGSAIDGEVNLTQVLNSTISNTPKLDGYQFGVSTSDYDVFYDYYVNELFADFITEPIEISKCGTKVNIFSTVEKSTNEGRLIGTPSDFIDGNLDQVFYIPGYALVAQGGISDDDYQNATESEILSALQEYLNTTDEQGNLLSSYLNGDTKGKVVIDVEQPRTFGQIGTSLADLAEAEWFTQGVIKRIKVVRSLLSQAKLGVYALGTVHPQGSPGQFVGNSFDPLAGNDIESLPWLYRNLQVMDYQYDGKTLTESVDFISPLLWNVDFEVGEPGYEKLLNGTKVYSAKYVWDLMMTKHRENHPYNSLDIIPLISFANVGGPNQGTISSNELNKSILGKLVNSPLTKSKQVISEVASFVLPSDVVNSLGKKAQLESYCGGSSYYPFVIDRRPFSFNGTFTQSTPLCIDSFGDNAVDDGAAGNDGAKYFGEPGRSRFRRTTNSGFGNGESDFELTGDVFNANGRLTLVEELLWPIMDLGIERHYIVNPAGMTNMKGRLVQSDGKVVDANIGPRAFTANAYSGMGVTLAPNTRSATGREDINYQNPGTDFYNPSGGLFSHGMWQNTSLDDCLVIYDNPTNSADPNNGRLRWYPTPFNPNGIPATDTEVFNPTPGTAATGDVYRCWEVALQKTHEKAAELGMTDFELQAYIGWRPNYVSAEAFADAKNRHESGQPALESNYDRITLVNDYRNGSSQLSSAGFVGDLASLYSPARSPELQFWDAGFWDYEINGLKSLGFNSIGYDTGGGMWADGEDNGLGGNYFPEKVKQYGVKTCAEALPLDSFTAPAGHPANQIYRLHGVDFDGNGTPDERYEVMRYFALFPEYFGTANNLECGEVLDGLTEPDGTPTGSPIRKIGGGNSNSARILEDVAVGLDITKHELGVAFNLFQLTQIPLFDPDPNDPNNPLEERPPTFDRPQLTSDQFRNLVCRAHRLGYVLGFSTASTTGNYNSSFKYEAAERGVANSVIYQEVKEFLIELASLEPGSPEAESMCDLCGAPPEPTGIACVDGTCTQITQSEAEALGLTLIFEGQASPGFGPGVWIEGMQCADVNPNACSECGTCSTPDPIPTIGLLFVDTDNNGLADGSLVGIIPPCPEGQVPSDPDNPPASSILTINDIRDGVYFNGAFFPTSAGTTFIEKFLNNGCGHNLTYTLERRPSGQSTWRVVATNNVVIDGVYQGDATKSFFLSGSQGDDFRVKVRYTSSCPTSLGTDVEEILQVSTGDWIITLGGPCVPDTGGCVCTAPGGNIETLVCSPEAITCFYPPGSAIIFNLTSTFPTDPVECVPTVVSVLTDGTNTIPYNFGDCIDTNNMSGIDVNTGLPVTLNTSNGNQICLVTDFTNCHSTTNQTLCFSTSLPEFTLCGTGFEGTIPGAFTTFPLNCPGDIACPACDCFGELRSGNWGPYESFGLGDGNDQIPGAGDFSTGNELFDEFGMTSIQFRDDAGEIVMVFGSQSQRDAFNSGFDDFTIVAPDFSPLSLSSSTRSIRNDNQLVFTGGEVSTINFAVEGEFGTILQGTYSIFL